jgi:hypothetical protein
MQIPFMQETISMDFSFLNLFTIYICPVMINVKIKEHRCVFLYWNPFLKGSDKIIKQVT